MKVLLVSFNRSDLPLPVMPMGACLVAEAAERAGHRVRLLDLMFERDAGAALERALDDFAPEAIGISVRNVDNIDMRNPVSFLDSLKRMVKRLRALTDVPLILGGSALGVMPEQILRFVPADCAVIGEGEETFPRLLDRLGRGGEIDGLPGVAALREGIYHGSPAPAGASVRSPSPDFTRWLDVAAYRFRMATVPIRTRTGCPFGCIYCTYPRIEGEACRFAEPGSVAEAVRRYRSAGFRDMEIVDSVFNAPAEHALEVCSALARIDSGARLQCLELNPLHLDDRLLAAMERAGFVGMGITLESAADPVLEGLNKGFTSREVHLAAEAVKRHAIPCAWIFLLGGPGETEGTVRETLRFAAKRIRPGDIAYFNVGVRIYPGTEMESLAGRQGVLTGGPEEMLDPRFYLSPEVSLSFLEGELKRAMETHMNFVDTAYLNRPFLPAVSRLGARMGLRPPLWRHTRIIRRGLRLAGLER